MRTFTHKTMGRYSAPLVAYQMGLKGYAVGSGGSDAPGCYTLGFWRRTHSDPPMGRQLAMQNAAVAEAMIVSMENYL